MPEQALNRRHLGDCYDALPEVEECPSLPETRDAIFPCAASDNGRHVNS